MRHEPDPRARVQVEKRLELLSHAHLRGLVRGRAGPEADFVLFRPDVDDDAADLVALGKLLADGRQQRVEPHGVERCFRVVTLGDEDGPLAAVLALGVLPLRRTRVFFLMRRGKRLRLREKQRDQSTSKKRTEKKKLHHRPSLYSYLGLDPLLEQVQVRAVLQPRGGLDVVVEPVLVKREEKRGAGELEPPIIISPIRRR